MEELHLCPRPWCTSCDFFLLSSAKNDKPSSHSSQALLVRFVWRSISKFQQEPRNIGPLTSLCESTVWSSPVSSDSIDFPKLSADFQQNLRPHFRLPTFYVRKVPLAHANCGKGDIQRPRVRADPRVMIPECEELKYEEAQQQSSVS